jgi:hypothetical protein
MAMRSTPPLAWIIALAGLIPFGFLSWRVAYGAENLRGPALLYLLSYSAAVLSYLGGVRWGAELNRYELRPWVLLVSTLPALAAWLLLAATIQFDAKKQLLGFIAAYALQLLWDLTDTETPRRYRVLRGICTAGVLASLGLAWLKAPI